MYTNNTKDKTYMIFIRLESTYTGTWVAYVLSINKILVIELIGRSI